MSTTAHKELKRSRRTARRLEERRSWEAELAARPLSPQVFSQLRQYIQEHPSAESAGIFYACEDHGHQLHLTLDFLRQRGFEVEKAVAWFKTYEATCDHLVVQLGDEWGPYGAGFEHRYA